MGAPVCQLRQLLRFSAIDHDAHCPSTQFTLPSVRDRCRKGPITAAGARQLSRQLILVKTCSQLFKNFVCFTIVCRLLAKPSSTWHRLSTKRWRHIVGLRQHTMHLYLAPRMLSLVAVCADVTLQRTVYARCSDDTCALAAPWLVAFSVWHPSFYVLLCASGLIFFFVASG